MENASEQIVQNTELIQENTEIIKKTGVRAYNTDRHKRIWDALLYSHQRMDTLIIAISGAGIYVCLETIKYYGQKSIAPNGVIKLSAFLLLVSVILNFISQYAASKAHSFDYLKLGAEIKCEEDESDESLYSEDFKKWESKAANWNQLNDILSIFGIAFMSLGLIGIIIFFTFIF